MAINNNELDAFERQLKERLEHYEVPFNSADWAQMERALASGVRSWGHGRAWLAGLLVASGLLIGGTAYFLGRDSGSQIAASQLPGAGQDTVESTVEGHTLPEQTATPAAEAAAVGPEVMGTDLLPTTAPAARNDGARHGQEAAPQATTGTALNTATGTPEPPAGPSRPGAATAAASTSFKASMKDACPGSPVEFTVENMPEDGIYLWNFGDGSFSNKPNPQHVFTKPGSYQVMLSMSSPGVGAMHNKPSSDMIVIHEAPYAAFNILKLNHAGQMPSVHFESRAHGAKNYVWDFGDGGVSTQANPDHVYRKKGTYQVVLTVTNDIGCTDRKVQELRIERDFDLGAPASFSPNSDGKEDYFMPQALLELKSKFQLNVYDKGGSLVYQTNDATRPWYGKLRNQGPVLPQGEYVWVVDLDGEKGTETFTGTVKLVP